MLTNHKVIVFAQEHYNPLGLIRSLGENGIYPILISVKRRGPVACLSKYVSVCHHVENVEEGFHLLLREYGNEKEKPYVLFSDDMCIGYVDQHYNEIKDKFVSYNAGEQGRISAFMDKQKILELAQKYGFKTLKSIVVNSGEIPKNIKYPIITKDISPTAGGWKSDVFICRSEEELVEASKKITSPKIQIQPFVDKKNELAIEGFTVNKGKEIFFGTALTWKYQIPGYYSPYHDVTMMKDREMGEKIRRIFEEIGFEGIFEVEFIIDKNDTYYFLEANFRASAWNYSSTVAGMPLSYLWVKSMDAGHIDPSDQKEFENFTDMSEVIDYGIRVDKGKISFVEWLRDFKAAKGTYYYNENDMAPFEYLFEHWDEYK